MLNIKANVFLT